MPVSQSRLHYVGDVWVNVTNDSYVGSNPGFYQGRGLMWGMSRPEEDMRQLRIDWQPSFEFPGWSQISYLDMGWLSFGCVQGIEALVSSGYEFMAYGAIRESSSRRDSPFFDAEAVAEQQYSATYTDTTVWPILMWIDPIAQRPHKPIGIEVHQTSYASSDGLTKQFVIVDCWIKNISSHPLRDACIGLTIEPRAFHYASGDSWVRRNDICGLIREVPGHAPGAFDTVNIAWAADNDGGPGVNNFTHWSPRGVLGARLLRTPKTPGGDRFSFNWWRELGFMRGWRTPPYWGPTRVGTLPGDFQYEAFLVADRDAYRLMTNGETDYDQVYSAIDKSEDGWNPPYPDADLARQIASGGLNTLLLSCGPIAEIRPGDSVPFTYALIAGANFHTNPRNFADNFDPYNPKRYLDNLDFSDLIKNARWAEWYFDTPGVDTDGDGYRGKYHLTNCNSTGTVCDTAWYKGDGVPDWTAPKPVQPPPFQLTTRPGTAILHWTGAITETAKDQVSGQRTFEGYRVYSTRFDADDKYELIASWDKDDDFTRWAYQSKTNDWKQVSYPLTIDEWRKVLEDSQFAPSVYTHPSFESAYRDTVIDTVRDVQGAIIEIVPRLRYSYWAPEGPNRGNRYWGADRWEDNLIQKIGERDTIIGDDTLTYGVYEMTLGGFNSSIPLYFAVTAFDYGDYIRNVTSLESSPHANSKYCHLLYSSDVVVDSGLQVSVYPNPYKIQFKDAFGNWTSYYRQGYEGLGKPVMEERDRRIWFINLPDTAEINIYTLDGDLVRKILHPDPFLTTYSSVVGWDLISRNTQAVVSGIYIWRVDSRLGKQIGKLVIIK